MLALASSRMLRRFSIYWSMLLICRSYARNMKCLLQSSYACPCQWRELAFGKKHKFEGVEMADSCRDVFHAVSMYQGNTPKMPSSHPHISRVCSAASDSIVIQQFA